MWGHSSARTDQITSLFHDRTHGPLDRWRGGVVHRRTSAIPGSRRGSEVAPALLFHASSLSRRELGPKQHTNGDPRCAKAARGKAATAPPKIAMNSRRLINAP